MTGEPGASVQRIADSLVSVIEQRDSYRDALWQIATNAAEHEGETDTSYEDWARSFARAALSATESAQPEGPHG